jgi:hypothetical protein
VILGVRPPEKLTCFIFSQRHYSIQKFRAKPSAFLPPPDLQISAFEIDALDDEAIWWIADNVVAKEARREPPPARAPTYYARRSLPRIWLSCQTRSFLRVISTFAAGPPKSKSS